MVVDFEGSTPAALTVKVGVAFMKTKLKVVVIVCGVPAVCP